MKQIIAYTKEALDVLPATGKRYYVGDSKMKGLQLAVHPSGSKTYFLRSSVKGRQQRIKIGCYSKLTIELARKEAKRLDSIITLGGDPHEERKAERLELTLRELFDIYYTQHSVVHNKRPQDNRNMMRFHVFPAFGSHKAKTIDSEKMRRLHALIAENRGKAIANRVVHIVSSVFNFAIKNDYFNGKNPCHGVKKFMIPSRDRFLNQKELGSFFEALDEESDLFRDYFSLLLFTGVRKTNLLMMRWADIDFDLKRWRIAETHTKNKDVNIVSLSEPVLEILNQRESANDSLEHPSPYVFPSENGDGYLKDPKRSFNRIKKRMEVNDFRIHDLRRTLGSYMAINGASLPMIGKALNHKSQVSTAIYARLSQDPVLEAVNLAVRNMKVNNK